MKSRVVEWLGVLISQKCFLWENWAKYLQLAVGPGINMPRVHTRFWVLEALLCDT